MKVLRVVSGGQVAWHDGDGRDGDRRNHGAGNHPRTHIIRGMFVCVSQGNSMAFLCTDGWCGAGLGAAHDPQEAHGMRLCATTPQIPSIFVRVFDAVLFAACFCTKSISTT